MILLRNSMILQLYPILFQVADPFYVFQFCSIVLWSTEDYYYYALAILIVTVVSITITVYQTKVVSHALLVFPHKHV